MNAWLFSPTINGAQWILRFLYHEICSWHIAWNLKPPEIHDFMICSIYIHLKTLGRVCPYIHTEINKNVLTFKHLWKITRLSWNRSREKQTLMEHLLGLMSPGASPQFHQMDTVWFLQKNGYRMTFEGNQVIDIHLSMNIRIPDHAPRVPETTRCRGFQPLGKQQRKRGSTKLVKRSVFFIVNQENKLKIVCNMYIFNYSIVAEIWHLDSRCDRVYIKVHHQPNSMNFLGTTFSLSW